MTRAWSLALCVVVAFAAVACGPERVRENRTEGLALELRWMSADRARASYYEISEAGEFASSGGLRARDRAVDFKTRLDDAEVARFVDLVRATDFARRARKGGESGDQSEISVIEDKRRASFTVAGPDPAVDGLLGFLREVSLRQFRDVIDAQPQSGERRR